jgi:CubicO group peptidase (beta-lactamase class C family)
MYKIKKRFARTYLGLLFCWLCLIGCATSPAPITDKSGDSDFAQILESIRQKENLPAIAASVIIDGDIYVKAAVGTRKYGTENWVTIDDKFLIGSCGKAFTATLAAILINEGLLQWDTSVGVVFPEIKMHPEWESITIQQLLTNRSGYADDTNSKLLPNDQLLPLWHDNNPPMDMRNSYMKIAINVKPRRPPNEVVIYANSGFLVAGVMLETVANKSFENLMQEKLFNPLALNTAGYGSPATIDPISQPYGHFSNSPIKKDFPDYIAPMGNVAISIGDWSKFVLFHLNTYQDINLILLDSVTLQKLHTPPNSATWVIGGLESWIAKTIYGLDPKTFSYAFGWGTKKETEGNYLLLHDGQGSSFSARVEADPKSKSAILIVTNARADLDRLREAAKKIRKYYAAKKNLPNHFAIP